jgi:hypothetical protein
MKTRSGFVSNSSSSSFMVVGEYLPIANAVETDFDSGLIAVGRFLCEGLDVFTVKTIGMLDFIKNYPTEFKLYTNATLYSDNLVEVDIEPDGITKQVVSGVKDQNSSHDIDGLLKNYNHCIESEIQTSMDQVRESAKDKYR